MGLRDNHGQVRVAQLSETLQLLSGSGSNGDAVRAVDLGRNLLNLGLDGVLKIVGVLQIRNVVTCLSNHVRQVGGTLTALCHTAVDSDASASFLSDTADGLVLGLEVGREGVNCHDRLNTEVAHDLDVLLQVLCALLHVGGAFLQHAFGQGLARNDLVQAGVGLQGAYGHDEHCCVRLQAGDAALDVEETLRTHVGAEASLGNHVVGVLQTNVVGDHGGVTGCDVAEGARVNQCGGVLQGLQQVRVDSICQDDGHCAVSLQVGCGDGLAVVVQADHDLCQALAQVLEGGCQRENHHDFGGAGDVETGLADHAVHAFAQAHDDVAQGAVVHVDNAAPLDCARVDAQLVAVVQVVVNHGGKQVVCCGDGVEVAGQVQVQLLHGNDLGVAAACCAALDAEGRAHCGLTQSQDCLAAGLREALCEGYGGCGLTFTERGGGDCGNHDVLGAALAGGLCVGGFVEEDLSDILAVGFKAIFADAVVRCDLVDGPQIGGKCDFEVGRERLLRHYHPSSCTNHALSFYALAHSFVPHLAGRWQINPIFNALIPATGDLRSRGATGSVRGLVAHTRRTAGTGAGIRTGDTTGYYGMVSRTLVAVRWSIAS